MQAHSFPGIALSTGKKTGQLPHSQTIRHRGGFEQKVQGSKLVWSKPFKIIKQKVCKLRNIRSNFSKTVIKVNKSCPCSRARLQNQVFHRYLLMLGKWRFHMQPPPCPLLWHLPFSFWIKKLKLERNYIRIFFKLSFDCYLHCTYIQVKINANFTSLLYL